jgi:hypothetical protein
VLDKLIKELPILSKRVKNLPYDPTSWKARSIVLLKLSYPELAASDAYKGILLCNAAIDNGSRREDVLLHFGIANWQKRVNKKGSANVPLLDDVFENPEYQKWLDGEKSKEGFEDRTLNSLRGHRKDLWVFRAMILLSSVLSFN